MSIETNEEEYIILWQPPKLEPPEFRLYYDDKGAVICYTGDKSMTGNYIVIDAQTFAAARPDIKIIDGRISTASPKAVVYKLIAVPFVINSGVAEPLEIKVRLVPSYLYNSK